MRPGFRRARDCGLTTREHTVKSFASAGFQFTARKMVFSVKSRKDAQIGWIAAAGDGLQGAVEDLRFGP